MAPKDQPEYTPTESTDFSFAYTNIEDRPENKWVRRKVRFPLTYDRRDANYDYLGQEAHRSFGGIVPFSYYPPDGIKVKDPSKYNSQEFIFVNKAKNGSNIPQGYYGTSSGVFPINFIPWSAEDPTVGPNPDHPTVVHDYFEISGGNEFFVARNIRVAELDGVTAYYYPTSGAVFFMNKNGEVIQTTGNYNKDVGRFEWWITPEFQTAIEPEVRFPNGVRKRNYFSQY